jgi:hypothetical protein
MITRNECLSQFPAITRLGARINDLKEEGYEFETKQEHGDYVYRLVKRPAAKQLSLVWGASRAGPILNRSQQFYRSTDDNNCEV